MYNLKIKLKEEVAVVSLIIQKENKKVLFKIAIKIYKNIKKPENNKKLIKIKSVSFKIILFSRKQVSHTFIHKVYAQWIELKVH